MSEKKPSKEQVLEGLKSIHEQSITDRSHYYVRSVTRQAIAYIETTDSIPAESYDLKARIKELEDEVAEQCRLNGMGAQRELKLKTELAAEKSQNKELCNVIANLEIENRRLVGRAKEMEDENSELKMLLLKVWHRTRKGLNVRNMLQQSIMLYADNEALGEESK